MSNDTGTDLFYIREMDSADLPAVNAFVRAEGMGAVAEADLVFVAVSPAPAAADPADPAAVPAAAAADPDGQVVAFIRLILDEACGCHVNPVVVYPTWRRFGVGKALVEHALARYGELRLVSRGSSLAFYEALGFEEVPWDMICAAVAHECDECEIRPTCNPIPVRKTR
ncbi:MAG: GNAT family N-acetyltransferase [Eggerthellaceae bacterium]|nr:GNAT family N-acetyltransferase [Eggerthellaceae bacterium]